MTDLNQAYGSLIDVDEFPHPIPPPPVINNTPSQVEMKPLYSPSIPNTIPQSMMPQSMPPPSAMNQQPYKQQRNNDDNNSYFDKLFSKKRDLWKAIQLALIIALAMSIHFIIDHYLKKYFTNNDLSFERELLIRMLYPIGIIFIIWNLKVFSK